jgi:hypothetical protein
MRHFGQGLIGKVLQPFDKKPKDYWRSSRYCLQRSGKILGKVQIKVETPFHHVLEAIDPGPLEVLPAGVNALSTIDSPTEGTVPGYRMTEHGIIKFRMTERRI